MSLGMLANVYTMVRKRCAQTTERETARYTEDLRKTLAHTRAHTLPKGGGRR